MLLVQITQREIKKRIGTYKKRLRTLCEPSLSQKRKIQIYVDHHGAHPHYQDVSSDAAASFVIDFLAANFGHTAEKASQPSIRLMESLSKTAGVLTDPLMPRTQHNVSAVIADLMYRLNRGAKPFPTFEASDFTQTQLESLPFYQPSDHLAWYEPPLKKMCRHDVNET